MLDGADDNELTAGGVAIYSSIDSIQEFKVLTYNYSAEYGTRAGPTVLLTTKSGSNDFHGSLFEFLRNTDLDAKSFFATSTEKFNLNQFGGSIGGPIRKNKTFFFVDGEQKYQRHGITFEGLVPTQAMRNGDFTNDAFGNPAALINNPNIAGSADPHFRCDASGNPLPLSPANDGSQVAGGTDCNKIPSGLLNPLAQKMINFFPLPNLTGSSYSQFPLRACAQPGRDQVRHTRGSEFLQFRFSFRALQLRSGRLLRAWRSAGICRSQRVRQQPGDSQPCTQRGHRGDSRR